MSTYSVKKLVLIASIVCVIMLLTGCANTLNGLHSKEINSGCEMINATARLGYFGQNGNGSACKMICSKTLPKGYTYSFDNGQCKASVGQFKVGERD